MSGPHFIAGAAYVRGADGAVQKRTASLRLRLEPALLAALKRRAEAHAKRPGSWPDGRGAGASAYVRALIVADLEAAGCLDRDGGYVRPADPVDQGDCGHTSAAARNGDPRERSVAELVVADLEAARDDSPTRARDSLDTMLRYELRPEVRAALVALDQRWADQGI